MEEKKTVYGFGPLVDGAEDFKKFQELLRPVMDEESRKKLDNFDAESIGDKTCWISIADFTEEEILADSEEYNPSIEDIQNLWKWMKVALDAGYCMSLFKV